MAKILKRTLFGDPILRTPPRKLSIEEVLSPDIQTLIVDMRHTLITKKYGVGLAAPQVGRSVALSVISIRPMPHRPNVKAISTVIINPEIVKTYGRRSQMWEGCISFQGGSRDFPYAKALRYRKVRVRYIDEEGSGQEKDFVGLLSHVLQHEIDHLNGVLFVERVKDPKTYMMISEYKKHVLPQELKKKAKPQKRRAAAKDTKSV